MNSLTAVNYYRYWIWVVYVISGFGVFGACFAAVTGGVDPAVFGLVAVWLLFVYPFSHTAGNHAENTSDYLEGKVFDSENPAKVSKLTYTKAVISSSSVSAGKIVPHGRVATGPKATLADLRKELRLELAPINPPAGFGFQYHVRNCFGGYVPIAEEDTERYWSVGSLMGHVDVVVYDDKSPAPGMQFRLVGYQGKIKPSWPFAKVNRSPGAPPTTEDLGSAQVDATATLADLRNSGVPSISFPSGDWEWVIKVHSDHHSGLHVSVPRFLEPMIALVELGPTAHIAVASADEHVAGLYSGLLMA